MRNLTILVAATLPWALGASQASAWEIENPGSPINTEYHEAFSAVTADGLTLFVSSDRPGGYGSSEKGTYHMAANYDIYVSHRESLDAPWGPVVNLGRNINTSASEHSAMLSPDGQYLYFMSERPGGYGSQDIYRSYREDVNDDQGWEEAVNLGENINSPYIESCPVLFVDEGDRAHLFFIQFPGPIGETSPDFRVSAAGANGDTFLPARTVEISTDVQDAHLDPWHGLIWGIQWPGGQGGSDLWQTERIAAESDLAKSWTTPVNLGPEINTQHDETMPSATADGSRVFFMSDRPGGNGGMDIFEAVR